MSKYPEQLVFGLDIGTRSIVGTVGYKKGGRFYVVAQKAREHETRAMLDGQIHDIAAVAETIRTVKDALEAELEVTLKDVSIAAAGRVLKTVSVQSDEVMDGEREVVEEDVYALSTKGVELAYEAFQKENENEEMSFYCVGYSVVRYYLNDYPMGNLVGHKARKIGAELIATFLPDDVVDGLYKAVETAGLQVVNMTLEPIAAIGVAIPEMYRMLNIALVDVGAGTSDISITRDGAIIAFGMIPMAGDALTEVIARHCLVDFGTAEQVKKGIEKEKVVVYRDIMGLEQTISREELLSVTEPVFDQMAQLVAEKIKELNGDKSVSAVFVVGGGGKIQGYTDKLAGYLDIAPERVAVRGEQVMHQIEFVKSDLEINSLLVTPIGICLSFYEQSNNFIYVTFNEKRVKLYENSNLAVIDAAMQAQFGNVDLFPKRGTQLQYMVNGTSRLTRGEQGESAKIYVNGKEADIHSRIKGNDNIQVVSSTKGTDAKMTIGELPEYGSSMEFVVQGQKISVPKFVLVNGQMESAYYEIKQGDKIEFVNYYTVEQLLQFMDIEVGYDQQIYVNHYKGDYDTPVYEGFSVDWDYDEEAVPLSGKAKKQPPRPVIEDEEPAAAAGGMAEAAGESSAADGAPGAPGKPAGHVADPADSADAAFGKPADDVTEPAAADDGAEGQPAEEAAAADGVTGAPGKPAKSAPASKVPVTMQVIVNKAPVSLRGKAAYVYVDVFDYIDFDLGRANGRAVVTTLNGRAAQYMEPLHEGDVIEIYWKEQ